MCCRYGFQYYGKCALIEIGYSISFVSVTGGSYSCDGNTAFGISCQGCNNALVRELRHTHPTRCLLGYCDGSAEACAHSISVDPIVSQRT